MGRPLNKRYFGVNAQDNLKVQFFNGDASVPGFIVKQTGSKRFICEDKDGNRATCYLVEKASADLSDNEMTITVVYDNGTVGQITKIAAHKVTINGETIPWSFGDNTSDARVQIEEAGQDGSLTDGTDLEGDDGPTIPNGMDRNEPLPGSGTFSAVNSFVGAFNATGITFDDIRASGVVSVPNSTNGLYRRKYVGNFSTTYVHQTTPAFTLDMTFFGNKAHGPISEAAHEIDTTISFGQRSDLGYENNYAFEWKGYMQAPVTGNMRFFGTIDDDAVMWIGANALNPTASNYLWAQSGNNNRNGTHGVQVEAGKWYPVRLWFQEWGGAEKFQLGANNSVNGTVYGHGSGGTDFVVAHNSATKGF